MRGCTGFLRGPLPASGDVGTLWNVGLPLQGRLITLSLLQGVRKGRQEGKVGGEVSDGREEGPLVLPLRGLELDGGKDGEKEVGPVVRNFF